MKRLLIIVFFIIIFPAELPAITIDYTKQVETISLLQRTVVSISTPSKEAGTGTALVVQRAGDSRDRLTVIITCKHVVDSHDIVSVRFRLKSGAITTQKCKVHYRFEEKDLALMVIEDKSFSNQLDLVPFPMASLPPNRDLKAGLFVFIAGFPFNIGVNNLSPVIQSGIIAHVDTIKQDVLLDIYANKGNSGGPALAVMPDGETKFIGVVSFGGSGLTRIVPVGDIIKKEAREWHQKK